jgi:mannosyl-3-phosphoglycerate synthase
MNIDTVQFSHILETGDLPNLHSFLSRTAFVISHKNEKLKTLREVLWYLPLNSPIIIVTNCQESAKENLTNELKLELAHHQKIYLVHQKEETIARLFEMYGVYHILGKDGKVLDGKGEGMYIGTFCAYQLGYPRWIIFYDADNFIPSALLEYTMAMSRLFMSTPSSLLVSERETTNNVTLNVAKHLDADLHNVRICWSSKPELKNVRLDTRVMGRCTRVVSPLFNELLEGWFGMNGCEISSSNAGEQGMTVKTALSLHFSSGFSVETLQLLDLLFHAQKRKGNAEGILLQQYLSKSPHFHEKKGDKHIKKMIEESLGSFFHFEEALPENVKRKLRLVYDELCLDFVVPKLYPPLQDLQIKRIERFMDQYSLCAEADYHEELCHPERSEGSQETDYQDALIAE